MSKVKVVNARNNLQYDADGLVKVDDGGTGYVLPPATRTALGGVRVGTDLNVTPNGTISAVDQRYDDTEVREEIDGKQDRLVSGEDIKTVNGESLLGAGNIEIDGTEYTLPPATETTLGGLIVGQRLTVDANGKVDAQDQRYDDTEIRGQIASNTSDIADVNIALATKQTKLVSGDNLKTINGESLLGAGDIVVGGSGDPYVLPVATDTILGGVKRGTRVTIAPDGTISADDQSYDDSDVRGLIAGNASDIATLEDTATTHASQIAANAGNIATNAGDIADLETEVAGKQDTLISGTTLKTVNGETLLGSGDVVISGGGSVTAGNGLEKVGDVLSVKPYATVGPASGLLVEALGVRVNAGDGIHIVSNQTRARIDLATMQFTASAIAVKCDPAGGLEAAPANAGLRVKLAGDSIQRDANGLSVPKYRGGDTTLFLPDSFGTEIAVNIAPNSGIDFTSSGLYAKCAPAGGIVADASGLAVKPSTTGGIVADASGLAVKPSTTGGIAVDASGLAVKPSTTGGIAVNASGLAVKPSTTGGIAVNASGLAVKPSAAGGIAVNASGLAVKPLASGGIGVDVNGIRTTGFNFSPATAVTNRFPNGWVDIKAPASSSQSFACYEANGVGRYVATLGIAAGTGRGINVFAFLGRSDIPLLGTARVKFGYKTNANIYPLESNPDILTTPLSTGDFLIPLWWDGRATTITVEFFYFVIP